MDMISYSEALALLQKNAQRLPMELIDTRDSLGRIVSTDIYSPMHLPSFDNSAMDGFALKHEETIAASPDNPILFLVSEVIPAEARVETDELKVPFTCSQIMTGAAIPNGYDAVIPIELVEEINNYNQHYIQLTCPVSKSANVRFKDEDVICGTLVLAAGTQIKPSDLMLLCALGIPKLNVFKQIEIALASSGNEVSDQYDKPLSHGEIYNSNAPLLLSLASLNCFAPHYAGILQDDRQALYDFIQQNPEQVLITTGAVSKGKWDFIPETLRQLGAKIIFHNVAIRPGKPILFAQLKDGRFFLGLPGNPVSAMVGWRFFAIPLFYAMWGKKPELPLRLKLKDAFKKNHKLRQFLKAEMSIEDGIAYARINAGQESFKIKPLTTSNIWAIAEEMDTQIESGDLVNVMPLYASL